MTGKDDGQGILLRELRVSRGLSLSEAARRAGISPGALGNWEAGRRTPRGAPLDRLLTALKATGGTRSAILAVADPAHARIVLAHDPLGAPLPMGAMLRAMRLRRGFTQSTLARTLGVTQSTVAAWEYGDGIPESATLQAALHALDASEEEVAASLTWGASGRDSAGLLDTIGKTAHGAAEPLLLAYERDLWTRAVERPEEELELARAISYRAKWSQLQARYGDVVTLSNRAVHLIRAKNLGRESATGAFLAHAEMRLARGESPAHVAGDVAAWESEVHSVSGRAWTMSVRARALAMEGLPEAARIGREALRLVEDDPVETWFRRIDLATVQRRLGDPEVAIATLDGVYEDLVLGMLGENDIAHGLAEHAHARIEAGQEPDERELIALRTRAERTRIPWYLDQVASVERALARAKRRSRRTGGR